MHRTKKLHLVNHHDSEELDPEQERETYFLFPTLIEEHENHRCVQYYEGMLEVGYISNSFSKNKVQIIEILQDMAINIDHAIKFINTSREIPVSPTGLALGGITEQIVEDLDKTEVKLMLSPSEIKKLKKMGIIK